MHLKRNCFSWVRTAVLLWVSAWVLAVPLFHVHPGVPHRHGETVHVHGATLHTVLSDDLVWDEVGNDEHRQTVHETTSIADRESHRWDEHPQLEFSLLSDSTDRKSFKPLSEPFLPVDAHVSWNAEPCLRTGIDCHPVPAGALFHHTLSPRAPPSFLI